MFHQIFFSLQKVHAFRRVFSLSNSKHSRQIYSVLKDIQTCNQPTFKHLASRFCGFLYNLHSNNLILLNGSICTDVMGQMLPYTLSEIEIKLQLVQF